MLARRHIAAVLAAASFAAVLPASAPAQEDVPNLTPTPTTPEPDPGTAGEPGGPAPEPESPSAGPSELPNTGADPRLLVLTGAALLLTGAGLRLRTLDERF